MDRRIVWALAQMEARLSGPLMVGTLAAEVNLSPSRFAHLFQAQIGTSPARYLRALRMAQARLLLERTFLSVKEVMVQVGFSDPSHFSRDFKHFHRLSPTECRRQAAVRELQAYAAADIESRTVARVADLANSSMKRPIETHTRADGPAPVLHADDRERNRAASHRRRRRDE